MTLVLPRALADVAGEGKLVLFAGAGMSQPQLPGWGKLLESILERASAAPSSRWTNYPGCGK
jgi:hypothetical protein